MNLERPGCPNHLKPPRTSWRLSEQPPGSSKQIAPPTRLHIPFLQLHSRCSGEKGADRCTNNRYTPAWPDNNRDGKPLALYANSIYANSTRINKSKRQNRISNHPRRIFPSPRAYFFAFPYARHAPAHHTFSSFRSLDASRHFPTLSLGVSHFALSWHLLASHDVS